MKEGFSNIEISFPLLASSSFDISLFEYFFPLVSGGKVLMLDNDHIRDMSHLTEQLKSVNAVHAVPALMSQIVKHINETNTKGQYSEIKNLFIGGDSVPTVVLEEMKSVFPDAHIHTLYGPTESTIFVTANQYLNGYDNVFKGTIIGKPNPNSQIFILDSDRQLVPIGVIGEIYIGGMGVARGYLNQGVLTQEKFLANPFEAGDRLYRSGDLGRWLWDGSIEFIGRKDDQVKIRGYRIELGEIEHALLKHEQIEEAVVVVRENQDKDKELVAYVRSKTEQTSSELRDYLKDILPPYMLPGYYVQLSSFPLTANGKIDKKSLPDPEGLGLSSGVEYVAPRTVQQKALVDVWQSVLKRDSIGIKDSFYNLGGDSIKSIQVVSRLKQQGYTLKVEHILRTPVLEELSRLMQHSIQTIDQGEVIGKVGLSPIQRLFFEDAAIQNHSHFNQSVLLQSQEDLDTDLLEKSLSQLTRHHDALRMTYKQVQGVWEQTNQDTQTQSYTLDCYDLTQSPNAAQEMYQIGEALQSGINLESGPLLRAVHFKLKEGQRLGLIIHHLVVDGVSWRILLEDLSVLYMSYKEGKKPTLALKTDSFQRWSLLQKEYAGSKKIKKEIPYWEQICNQSIAPLPQDQAIAPGAASIDALASFSLDKRTTELLQTRVHGVYNTEINDVLLTSLALAIKEVFSTDKTVLKMEGHGREDIIEGVDISRTVGWFTTTYPFVLDVCERSRAIDSLIGIKEDLRRLPNKGIGYGILKYLSDEKFESKITPEIVFNYLGDFGSDASGSGQATLFEYAAESIGPGIAQENSHDAVLDVSGMLVMSELSMSIRYSKSRYQAKTIERLINSYEKNLRSLIEELSKSKHTYLTPSDLSFKGLSQQELSIIDADHTVEDIYELSPLQEGIYYHWLSEESSSLYFEQVSYRVRAKDLDIDDLKRAYDGLIARHGVLRTSFSNDYGGRPLQIVRKAAGSNFSYEKIKEKIPAKETKQAKQEYVNEIKQKDRSRGFDLSGSSQMRLHVIDLEEGEYEFIWSHHHILMDGWCMSILINDFNELLSSQSLGRPLDLSAVIPYSDYIQWLKRVDKEISLGYWKGYLSDYGQVAEIPFKKTPVQRVYAESREYLRIEGDLFNKIEALCNQTGITHNTFIQGVWGYLLSRYNNTHDVVFGAVVSGRPAELPGVEDMIGLFINTIPVRVCYQASQSPIELLKTLQEQSIQSTSHHYMNLSEVQSQSQLGRSLINHIVIFENYAVKEMTGEGLLNTQSQEGVFIESMEVFERANYDFLMAVGPSSTALNIDIRYNANQYDGSLLKRLIGHFGNLIGQFTEHAHRPLDTLNYLSEEEKQELLFAFNATEAEYPKDKTIVDLFREQAARTPAATAIVFKEKELTYRQLDELSDQLAHYLQKNYKIQPDDLVGLKLERSEWMIISILAVLKSGGAYVPIDPEYPQERIEYIEQDTKCKVCINDNELDKFRKSKKDQSKEKVVSLAKPHHLAYVIYTSGSTGKPKGVMIEHGNLSQFFNDNLTAYDNKSPIIMPLIASYAFDISIFQLFTPLLSGGTSIVVSKGQLLDTASFFKILNNVTVIDTVPAVYESLLNSILERGMSDNFLQVQRIFIGGDMIPDQLLFNLAQVFRSAIITVTYGPTEGTIFCTDVSYPAGNITPDIKGIFIGLPKNNVQIHILDEGMRLIPTHTVGEIYIGGEGLAKGYLNNLQLTREKFIDSPFKKGEKLYKTGDLGRRVSNGGIEFAGRNDDQIKLRGYRIELGEISNQLQKYSSISDALVVAIDNRDGDKSLAAYFVREKQIQVWPSISEYLGYSDLAYYAMNADESRAGSYKQAITELVKGKVVVDVGTGPDAILAQHCINAGATKVYAIEILEEVYLKAKERITSLGLDEKIVLIHGDVLEIELPEQVDYCICALVGNMGSSDGCIPIMNSARRFLKDPTCMIPCRSLTKIAAIYLPKDQTSFAFTESGAYYLNAIFENVTYPFDIRIGLQNVTRQNLISTHGVFEDLDLTRDLPLDNKRFVEMEITIDSQISGFLVWLNLYTTPHIVNNIFESQKSFLPIYLPVFESDGSVKQGDKIEAEIEIITPSDSIYPDYRIRGRIVRQQAETISFSYLSKRLTKEIGKTEFYKQIFPNGKFVTKPVFSAKHLQDSLRLALPDYMIPSHYIELDKMPLTRNGKIDKNSLRAPLHTELAGGTEYISPRNEVEEKLVKIWQEVLQRENIGIRDNFFAIGGHSLAAIKVVSKVNHEFKCGVKIENLFRTSTVEGLSDVIDFAMSQENIRSKIKDLKEIEL